MRARGRAQGRAADRDGQSDRPVPDRARSRRLRLRRPALARPGADPRAGGLPLGRQWRRAAAARAARCRQDAARIDVTKNVPFPPSMDAPRQRGLQHRRASSGSLVANIRRSAPSQALDAALPKRSTLPPSALPTACPSAAVRRGWLSTMSGARSVSRSSRLTKLRVPPSASASSPADRLPALFQYPLPAVRPGQGPDQRLVRRRLRRCPRSTRGDRPRMRRRANRAY